MTTNRCFASMLVVGAGLAGLSQPSAGQDEPDSVTVKRATPRWTIGATNMQFGVASLGLDELNTALTAHSRPAFSTTVATVSMSGHARFGRVLIGGTGEMALPQKKLSSGWVNKISFSGATIDAGIAVIERPRFLVYPQVSLGVRHTSLRIEPSGDFTFDAALADPARGVTLSSWSVVAGYGLVAETHLKTRRTGPFSVGVRAGFSTPLGNPSTSAGDSDVAGAPRESGGRYVRLVIGKPIGRRADIFGVFSRVLLRLVMR